MRNACEAREGLRAKARARLAVGGSPVDFPLGEPSGAEMVGRGRRERATPVEKKRRVYFVIQGSNSGSGMFPAG